MLKEIVENTLAPLAAIAIVVMLFAVYYQIQVHRNITHDTQVRETKALNVMLEHYKRGARKAGHLAGVIAHCANGGAFKVGFDILVQCTKIEVPEGSGIKIFNAVR